jgi:hypothetical protein
MENHSIIINCMEHHGKAFTSEIIQQLVNFEMWWSIMVQYVTSMIIYIYMYYEKLMSNQPNMWFLWTTKRLLFLIVFGYWYMPDKMFVVFHFKHATSLDSCTCAHFSLAVPCLNDRFGHSHRFDLRLTWNFNYKNGDELGMVYDIGFTTLCLLFHIIHHQINTII